jgi:hypothetical protein
MVDLVDDNAPYQISRTHLLREFINAIEKARNHDHISSLLGGGLRP